MPVLTYSEELHASISTICHADGVGCDGYQEDRWDQPCECQCHGLYAPTFITNADVKEWHLPSSTYRVATDEDRADYRARLVTGYDGTVYALRPQYR